MKYNKFWKFIYANIFILQVVAVFSFIFYMIIIYSIHGYQEDITQEYTKLGLWWTFPSMFVTVVLHNIAFRLKIKEDQKRLDDSSLNMLALDFHTRYGNEGYYFLGFKQGFREAERRYRE